MPRSEQSHEGVPAALRQALQQAPRGRASRCLAEAVRELPGQGLLRAGERLPSQRSLAGQLGCSRTLVTAAFDQLHAEGWLETRRGSGTYLVAEAAAVAFTSSPRPVPVPPESTDTVLLPGTPLVDVVDRAAWRRAWRAASDGPPSAWRHPEGTPEYLQAVALQLLRHRGLPATELLPGRRLLATAGTSAALAEVAQVVLQPGDTVAIEEPGYTRAAATLRACGMRAHPVAVDERGLLIDRLPEDASAVYCTPAHQYPTGGRLPAARRVALIRWARSRGVLLLEDDYDGEMRWRRGAGREVDPLPVLAGMAPDVVVHLGTTSKILSRDFGVGWMHAPPRVIDAVRRHRAAVGTAPAVAGQRVVAALARSGDLARHLRRVRRELARRRTLLLDAASAAGVSVRGEAAGAHVMVPVDSAAGEERVVHGAGEAGIQLDGLARHHLHEPSTYGIVLGYAGCGAEQLQPALETVFVLLARAQSAGACSPMPSASS